MRPMAQEIEAKFSVESLSPFQSALAHAGAEFLGAVIETDAYYDTPEAALLSSDRGLRVRTFCELERGTDLETGPLLTFKGPMQPTGRLKVRSEMQTRVADPEALDAILEALGVSISMRVQKRRRSYRMGACRVELDELPLLGCFVEIEGPNEQAIDAVCRQLGLQGEPIRTPYVRLLAEHCREHGLDEREVTFEGR